MLDTTHLESILHANNISSESSEDDIKKFLFSLKWPENEITESLKYLRSKGWFVVKNPFTDSASTTAPFSFKLREYIKYLKVKIFKTAVYIDEPLKKPPVFNTYQIHSGRLSEEIKRTKTDRKFLRTLIVKIIRDLIIISLIFGTAYAIYIFRFDIEYLLREYYLIN